MYRDILVAQPDINNIYNMKRYPEIRSILKFGRNLDRNNYTYIFDLHNSLRSKIVRQAIHAEKTFIVRKPRLHRFFLKYLHKNTFPEKYSYKKMLHDSFRSLIPASEPYPDTMLSFRPPEARNARFMVKQFRVKLPFVAIVPGAAWKNKQWDARKYLELCERIMKAGHSVVLLGGKKDKICDDIGFKNYRIFNLKGECEIRDSFMVISQSEMCIGSDTGMIHAAEAYGIPVITLLGPTTREMGAGSQLEKSIDIENRNVWCRPCSQNGKRDCYRSSRVCLDTISVDDVFNAYQRMLQP